jgi:hypothetical protein
MGFEPIIFHLKSGCFFCSTIQHARIVFSLNYGQIRFVADWARFTLASDAELAPVLVNMQRARTYMALSLPFRRVS